MFRNSIGVTPLSDGIAEGYFKNRIYGTSVGADKSFVVTLRALFERRLPEEGKIRFKFTNSTYRDVESNPVRDIVHEGSVEPDTVWLHAFCRSDPDVNGAFMKDAEKYYGECDGWTKLQKPTEYYARTMRVLVFVNAERKSAVIFIDSSDIRKIHFLEAGMLSFLPWYFNPADGFSATEKALCESLMKTSQDDYLAAVAAIAAEMDFIEAAKKKTLAEFESRFDRERIAEVKNDIERLENTINDYNREISNALQKRYDLQVSVVGLEEKIARGDSGELAEYFMSNKSLSFLGVTEDGGIDFAVKGYAAYWEEDMAKRVIENMSSCLYEYDRLGKENLRKLYTAVFVDRKVKLRMCAAFRIRPRHSIERPHPYNFPASEFGTYMPNIHIDRFGCIGSNEAEINELMRDHDYIGVMEQCIASALAYNFADSAVMGRFAAAVNGAGDYSPNTNAFELPDGTVTNPEGVIEWLNKEESEG